jgi:hypothetical protein
MVSAVVPRPTQTGGRGIRRLFTHAVEGNGNGPVSHGDHLSAEAVPLLVLAAIAVKQSAVAQLHPVDGELLELLDAVAAHGDS